MNKLLEYSLWSVFLYFASTRLFYALLRKYDWQLWYRRVYLNSHHWHFMRWLKKMQARFYYGSVCCEKCGSRERIQIHHITYQRIGREWLSDLQCICGNCHRRGSGRI